MTATLPTPSATAPAPIPTAGSPTASSATPIPAAEARMQRLLRLDALATGVAGLVGLLAPLSLWGDVPALLPRAVGAVLLLVGADLLVASRWRGRRLRLTTTLTAELAVAWVAATVVVLAVHDLPLAGAEVLGMVGLVTAGFAVAELRAVRAR